MKHSVTFGQAMDRHLSALLEAGIYGRTKSEIVRRFAEEAVQAILREERAAAQAARRPRRTTKEAE